MRCIDCTRCIRFTAVLCFTMLHHIPAPELQDKVSEAADK